MDEEYVRSKAARFIVGVFMRPGMYTLRGTYEEAYAFIHGFVGGQTSIAPAFEAAQVWFELGECLRHRYGGEVSESFIRFGDTFGSSDEACKAMAEYVQSLFRTGS